jgi:uncharacterized protein (DUF2147 family)
MVATMIIMSLLAAAPTADSVIGNWKTETRNGIVDIHRCGSSICGTLVTSDGIRDNPGFKDINNKDASQRNRVLKGIMMLQGFSWEDGAWNNGQVYNPDDGRIYKGRITPVDADHLKLRGCVFVPLCKTQTWTRLK